MSGGRARKSTAWWIRLMWQPVGIAIMGAICVTLHIRGTTSSNDSVDRYPHLASIAAIQPRRWDPHTNAMFVRSNKSADSGAAPLKPRFHSLSSLLNHPELFPDDDLQSQGCFLNASVPAVFVVDNFFSNAEQIREMALHEWHAAGPGNHGSFLEYDVNWWASLRASGWLYDKRFDGFNGHLKHLPDELKQRFEELVGSRIHEPTWHTAGDNWNGAFHVKLQGGAPTALHTHNARGDTPCGWFGVYYLNVAAPASEGTWIWRQRSTGRAVMNFGRQYHAPEVYAEGRGGGVSFKDEFEALLTVQPKFNRMLIGRTDVLHSGSRGFGSRGFGVKGARGIPEEPRMYITYFFNVQSPIP